MSKGEIVESGTHNELLEVDGAYAALVTAQQLKEEETGEVDPEETSPAEVRNLEAAEAKDREPLKRMGTGRSEASQVLEDRQKQEAEAGKPKQHGIAYLLYRMIYEIKETKWYYIIGSLLSVLLGMVVRISPFDFNM